MTAPYDVPTLTFPDDPVSGDLVPVVFLRWRPRLRTWAFDCPWGCRDSGGRADWHSHGWAAGTWGLRTSHCPLYDGSYVILPEESQNVGMRSVEVWGDDAPCYAWERNPYPLYQSQWRPPRVSAERQPRGLT